MQPLPPGTTIEREISPEEKHRYTVTLQAGQFMRVFVNPRNTDGRFRLYNPAGQVITELFTDTSYPLPIRLIPSIPAALTSAGEEIFRHAVFTPASNARLHLEPSKNWRALGLGVTKAHGENIPALPGVAEEMRGIIKSDGNSSGVLPGTIKLDEQFTQESMLTGLRERNNVVHIASHFQFQPGNETNSALLLGDGNFLSLANIKTMPNVFAGVELLTLSACNTATSGSGANGKEIEGFGVLAQRQGARAVIASLWPVADRSTMRLMQEFYQLRESGLTKAEAMRQAQSKMLRGANEFASESKRQIIHEEDKTANTPKFKADPRAPYAHPYYWAPFILIGNWK